MTQDKEQLPDCFGNLDIVFPMQENGLRQTPEDCYYHCPVKTRCLKHAMGTTQGARAEEEMVDRGAKAGVIPFFERWSRKKRLHERMQSGKKGRSE